MSRATLFAGFGGGLAAVVLLAPATATALGDLARARAAQAKAAVAAARPSAVTPLLASGMRTSGGSEVQAARTIIHRIRTLGAAGGVLVEQAEPLPAGGGLVRVRLKLSGADKAVVALADRLEREAPLVRLDSWQVRALADGGVRLDGVAVAAWR